MLELLLVLAEEGNAPPGFAPGPLVLMLGIGMLFFLIVLRPAQRRQERERQALLNGTKKGDKVLTSAGIYGTVVSVSEKEDEIVVKVDDNARLKMLKGSIVRNISAEEAQKAEKEAAAKAKETK